MLDALIDRIKARLGMAKPQPVGVDISPDGLMLAKVSKGKAGYAVQALAHAPLPPEALAEGEIADPEAVGQLLRELLDAHAPDASSIVVGVAGQSAVIRLINLPQMPADELESYVEYEAERYIPFSLEDVNLSTQIVTPELEGEEEMMEVLLVAAQKALVNSYLSAAEVAGIELGCVDVAGFAVARALTHAGFIPDEQAVAVLAVQGASTDINILASGVPKFNRTAFVGYTYLFDSIVSALGYEEDAAHALLAAIDVEPEDYAEVDPEHEQAVEIIRPALSELAGEISRSLDFFLSQGVAHIDRIVLTGRGAALLGLDRFLSARLGIEVVVGDPLAGLDASVLEAHEAASGTSYVTAIGLAMRGVDGP